MTDQMARTTPGAEPVDRRAFLNRVWLAALSVFAVAFSGASIAVLWPERVRGFGERFVVGKREALLRQIELHGRPIYHVEGRFYLVAYPTDDPTNRYVRDGVAKGGLMALYQKCSHIGCRTPYCATSGYFECPCHGALFNMAGERRGGPAPAGMWRFALEIDDRDNVIVDTSRPIAQPPRGVDTTGQRPQSHCLEDVQVDG